MNPLPLVSVCIASYNHEKFVAEAVNSVITQSYSNYELIVVDDASTDDSPEILQVIAAHYPDRIRLVLLEKNSGPSVALNRAILEAKGEYVALLGSDDRMHVDRLKKQVEYLNQNPHVATVFTRVVGIDAEGNRSDVVTDIFDTPISDIRIQLLQGNFLSAPSVMARRDVWLEVGLHNAELRYLQDYDLWLRILDNHEIARLDDRLTDYRLHGANLSVNRPQDVAFACHYETAICALNAIQRWSLDRLYSIPANLKGKAREAAIITAKVAVARLCLKIDQSYFQRPLLGTTQAYRYALEAVQMAPGVKIVQDLVSEVYRVLGDELRADGNGELKLTDWHEQPNSSAGRVPPGESGNARQAPETTGVSERIGEPGGFSVELYNKWREHHALKDYDITLFENRMRTKWSQCPSVHFVLIDVHTDRKPVVDSVSSVLSQLYSGWGLSVVSGGQVITEEFDSEPNLEWIETDCLEAALEKLVRESSSDWISFLFSGDQLERHYLVSMLDLADLTEGVEVVYSDTDSVNTLGKLFDAKFKPEADIDLLRSSNYIGNACLLKTETVKKNIGLVSLAHYGFVYGVLLKIIEDGGEGVFAHDTAVLFHSYDENARLESLPTSISRRRGYLQQHLERCALKSQVIDGYRPGVFYVEYQHATAPLVSIIIPTKDGLEVLEPCISSLLGKTVYRNFEVIVVDNNSSKPETLEYFDKVQRDDPRIRVVKYPKPYNFSAITNMAAELAKGDYLVLLNNDTEVIKEDWLDRMLSLGQREDVGIVGVRLLYPDSTIQHAGVVVGMSGCANHSHDGAAAESPGYMGQNLTVRGVSAVTAACLLIEKDLYFSVGGLDEESFGILFNDVDLCLKVRERELRVVYTPYAVLMHHGSFSLKKKKKANKKDDAEERRLECLALIRKWLPVLANDPAYNRNLGLSSRDVLPEENFFPGWDMHRHDCLRLVVFSTGEWSDDYFSVKSLLSQLEENNSVRCAYVPAHGGTGTWMPQPVELEQAKPDVLLLRAPMTDLQLNALEYYAEFNTSVFRVLVLDNRQGVPVKKLKKPDSQGYEEEQRLLWALASCDRLLVPTSQLADAWSAIIDDVRVVPDADAIRAHVDGSDAMEQERKLPHDRASSGHLLDRHLDAWLAALTPPVATHTASSLQQCANTDAKADSVSANQPENTRQDIQRFTRRMMSGWTLQPSIHLVMTHVSGQEAALADTLDSLGKQLYGGWGLSIVSSAPCPDPVFEDMEMLEWHQVEGDLMDGVNTIVKTSGADWLGLLEAGTILAPHMLYQHVEHLHQHPEWHLVYMDEDRIDASGEHYDPLFKPDFNLELQRAIPYMGKFILLERETLLAAGAYGQQTGAEIYDAVFRVIEQSGEQVVGHIPDVLIHRQDRFQLAQDQDLIAANRHASVAAHLKRCGIDGEAKPGTLFGSCFVDYACDDKPPVEIIVPVNGKPETLELFLDSLLSQTEYPHFRVRLLVRDAVEIPAALRTRDNIDVVSYPQSGIQWQEVLELVRNTDTEYLMLMSPGAIAIQPNWLERLVAHFQKPGVAVVAPRLVSSDKTVVGGGIITGAGSYSVGMGAFGGLALEDSGYMGRAQVAQELSAVSTTCMLVRKSVFESVEGVSTALRLTFYQAVDFCLRVSESGGKIVWTPHSTLMYIGDDQSELEVLHLDELVIRESETICANSLSKLANDPAYNPNLSLAGERFYVDDSFSPHLPQECDSLQRVVGVGAGSIGSWKFRIQQPLKAMHGEGVASSLTLPFSKDLVQLPSMAELKRLQVDSLLMHNAMHDPYMDAMEAYKRVNQTFIVFGQDDLMYAMPPKNPFSQTIYKDVKKRLRRCLGIADRVIVTTQPLADELRSMADDIRVVPNYLDEAIWGGLRSQRGVSDKPRVGWAGAQQHLGDLELLEEVVRETADEVDWVFFGMCPEFLQPYVKEIHNPVTFGKYPQKLATLNLDLAVAPLEHNRFNECKSNLRLLEYGVLGWPVIASDIAPYREGPVCRVHNQARAWIKAIRERIHDMDASRQEGDVLRDWVRENWLLQQHLNDWLAALDPASDCRHRHRARGTAAGFSR
jgi:GT2 family glycosyltransferase